MRIQAFGPAKIGGTSIAMKAAITPRYGSPDVIEVREVPTPKLGDGQLLIQVHATHVSAGDLRIRAADFPGISSVLGRLMLGLRRPKNPIQGTMFAGEIVELGPGVTQYRIGQRVFGSVEHGAYAEYLVAKEDGPLALIPPGRTACQAAALFYGAGTALHFLRDVAKLQPDERVLILGASGGVGRFALQLAQHMGADVTAVGRTRDFELMKSLGANQVLDYTRVDYRGTGQKYDLIFDIADASSFSHCKPALATRGRYLSLYIHIRLLLQMAWTSVVGRQRALFSIQTGSARATAEVADLFAKGVFEPILARRFHFEDIAKAHEASEARATPGAIVISHAACPEILSSP